VEIEVKGISVDIDSSHTTIDKDRPPPTMILSCQLKVEKSHSIKAGDNDNKDEGKEQDAEEGVDLVSPHTCKDVMQLDVNGGKGQESCHAHLKKA